MQKKTLIIVFITVLGVLSASVLYSWMERQRSAGVVNWLSSYDAGVAKAKAENKIVLIDFYADWCSWCKTLDQETYGNNEVASYLNGKLVCIKINVDQNIDLSDNYNITGLPTIVFLSSSGIEVGRILGYESSDQFLTYVRNIVSNYG